MERRDKATAGIRRGECGKGRGRYPSGREGDGMEGFKRVEEGFEAHMRVRNYSARSIDHYRKLLKGFWGYLEGKGVKDVRRVGKPLLVGYQVSLREWRGEGGKAYSWATVAAKVQAVRRLFEWLEGSGRILVNPAEGLPQGRAGDRLPRNVLTEEQVEKLMDQPDLTRPEGVRDRAILEAFYSTGLRLSEMTGLTLMDVDLGGGLVRVREGKGAKDRVVPIGETALRWVREYLLKVRRRFTRRAKKGTQALWVNHVGGPLSFQLVGIMIRNCGKKAGLKVSAHVLRHTFATQLVRNGADVAAVAGMLGHSGLGTAHRYARVAGVDLKKAHEAAHPRERDEEEPEEAGLVGVRGGYRHG